MPVAVRDSIVTDDDTDTPVTALTKFKANNQITRKNHSHPAAYALLHVVSEKIYVGSTENLYIRTNMHKNRLLAGQHKNKNLQEAFNRDSRFSLAFVQTETKEQATEIEQKMLDTHMPSGKLLNISPDAQVANKGVLLSDQRKALLRQKTTEQFSTKEAREQHSQISKTLWRDPEYLEKQKVAMAKVDLEQKSLRITQSLKDKWRDPEYRTKMEAARKRPVIIESVVYPSIKEAAKHTNISKTNLYYRIKNTSAKFAGYSYISKKEKT